MKKIIIASTLLTAPVFAQSIDVPQSIGLVPSRLGITTPNNSGPGLTGVADVSAFYVNTIGAQLLPNTIMVSYADVWTNAAGSQFAAGLPSGNNNSFVINFDSSIVQTDGLVLIDADINAKHGNFLATNTTDGFSDAVGTSYAYIGTNGAPNVVSTFSPNGYQVANSSAASAGNTGTIEWEAKNISSADLNYFATANNVNNTYTTTLSNLTFVPEPSSTLLLGLAGLGFLTRRKRA